MQGHDAELDMNKKALPGREGRTGVVQQGERLVQLPQVRLVKRAHRHCRKLVQDRAPANPAVNDSGPAQPCRCLPVIAPSFC